MRPKAFVLLSVLPIALSVAVSSAGAQRVVERDCWSRFGSRSRFYSCSYDVDAARIAREAASRARAEAREAARWARSDTRAFAARARENARSFERSRSWDRSATRARLRADELRERLRDRLNDRFYDNRNRYHRRW